MAALFALPWLHVKYSALAAGLLLGAAVRGSRRPAAWGSAALALSLLALSGFNALHYGKFGPTASYGQAATVLSTGVVQGGLEAAESRTSLVGCMTGLAWTLSLWISWLLLRPPPTWLGGSRALIYQDPIEPSSLLVLLSRGWDLCSSWPDMVSPGPRDWALGL